MKPCNFKSRKAISTIVGTFFFVIVMVGAFTAFILMMQTNSEFLVTQLGTSQNEIQKIQGQFTITAAYDSAIGNRLCVSVKNSGSTPLEIADLFIVNKTNNVVRQFDIDFRDAFVPVSSIRQILENQPITLTSGRIYDIKVVSTSGNVQTTELKVFSGSSPDPRLNSTVFVYPANAPSGVNVTVGLQVYNRANTTLINVQPNNGRPSVDPAESVAENAFPLITNLTISRLDPNEDVLFLWDPEIIGGVGSKLTFTANAKALVEGCTSSSFITSEQDSARVKVIPGVKKQILASPETLVSFPSPFGSSATKGVFSLVVQNPTSKPFTVSQVAILIITPDSTDSLQSSIGVTPTVSDWTRSRNVLTWKGTPVSIPAFDMKEFIVRAEPSASIKTAPINGIIFNVYSSFGQFGKGPFTLGTLATSTAIVNTYAQNSFTTATQGGSPVFAISDVQSGTTCQKFHFTISNNGSASVDSNTGSSFLSTSSNSYLLINIPAGLRDIQDKDGDGIKSEGGGSDPCDTADQISSDFVPHALIEFEDGSKQKAVALIGPLLIQTARTYTMTATMPTISVPAHYIFTLTANGTASSALVGPLAEIDVQVCPTAGCP